MAYRVVRGLFSTTRAALPTRSVGSAGFNQINARSFALRAAQASSQEGRRFFRLVAAGAATAATVGALCATALSDSNIHIDPTTKLQFPTTLAPNPAYGSPAMTLVGTGCRYKYGWVQVYAVGLYLDNTGVKFLQDTTTETSAQLHSSNSFYHDLIESPQPRVLVIKMNRDVDTPTMVNALEEVLRDRVEAREPNSQTGKFALVSFSKMISAGAGAQLTKGTEVSLIVLKNAGPEALVHILINGKGVGCVRSTALASSLFDTYLGPASISTELKTAVAKFFGKQ